MKRRFFFRGLGAGLLAPWLGAPWAAGSAPQRRPVATLFPGTRLSQARSPEGWVAVQIGWRTSRPAWHTARLKVSLDGASQLIKAEKFNLEQGIRQALPVKKNAIETPFRLEERLVVWIEMEDPGGVVWVKAGKTETSFSIAELAEAPEKQTEIGEDTLVVHLPGYQAAARLDLSVHGLPKKAAWRLAILADPQGGDPSDPENGEPTRVEIHNAFIAQSIKVANEMAPDLALVLGDFTDHQGSAGNFKVMERLFAPLKMPVFLAVGNHESRYQADFGPGCNLEPFRNYFESQQRLSGRALLLYAFDLGRWRVVVWPDPLRKGFWEKHLHFFSWLEQELLTHADRPVLFLHHVPAHPIGIDPLISYAEQTGVRRLLVDTLSQAGNVKYVLSGHVHIPIRSSQKTAVEHNGMRMVNLPASGYRPRAFGEPDFFGGPEQAVILVDLLDDQLTLSAVTVARRRFIYPPRFRTFEAQKYALWLTPPDQLSAETTLRNGDFSQGLQHWLLRFIYPETKVQTNGCETGILMDGIKAQHQWSEERGYPAPGQDRVPQTLNRICQVVLTPGQFSLVITYLLPNDFDPDRLNGPYLWLECRFKGQDSGHLIYAPGTVPGNLASGFGKSGSPVVGFFDLPASGGVWHTVQINPWADFSQIPGSQVLQSDRILIHLGVWTVNDGCSQRGEWWVRSVEQQAPASLFAPPKAGTHLWHYRIQHLAGEHQYANQAALYPDRVFDLPTKLKP